MKNGRLSTRLLSLLASDNPGELKRLGSSLNPVRLAEALAQLPADQAWRALAALAPANKSAVFANLGEEMQSDLAQTLPRADFAEILTHMPPDERVDLLKRIPEDRQETVLPALAQAEREDIRRLTAYPEGTAGAVMTSDYAVLRPELTVAEALARLRREAPDKETIYYCYVVDHARRLVGFVSLKDLILARPEVTVDQVMHRDLIAARVDEDQEEAARKIAKYDLLALPVVDPRGVLVGIVTHDDAIDIINQEHTEDLEKFMAISGSHEPGAYLRTTAWKHFLNRVYWIVGLAAVGLVSGLVIHHFEATLVNLLILALYMPMLADTGGNTGSQAATVVVRALALHEVRPRDLWRIMWKELRVAVLLAAILGVLSFGKVLFLSGGTPLPAGFSLPKVGLVISLALGFQVVSATLIGAVLPLCAAKLKLDPAVVASPALTTIVDITGLLIYFGTAKVMLGV
ncbi:MAG: magnesium transporter [Deltaproteobacteria bacterium]|nr:magnesium transporter [Deltaproteobacteria bacterium]